MRSFLNLFYRRTHANGLGMLSEPSDVLRVLKCDAEVARRRSLRYVSSVRRCRCQ
jgi:hypothetical protein